MKIVWDERERAADIAKYGLDFADVGVSFFRTAVIRPAKLGRYRAFGTIDGTPIALVFSRLGVEALSLISLRRANRRERDLA